MKLKMPKRVPIFRDPVMPENYDDIRPGVRWFIGVVGVLIVILLVATQYHWGT